MFSAVVARIFDFAPVFRVTRAFGIVAVTAVLSAGAVGVLAQERRPISGGMSGDLGVGEYLVTSVITVSEGDTLNIGAGAVLFFDQYTGIDVRGCLRALGDPNSPAVLTSVNDTAGSPESAQAFDWNGITAEGAAASLTLRHTRVANSVYGVNVRDPSIRAEFEAVVFDNNGYASLARGDDVAAVVPGEPFTALWNIDPPPPPPAPFAQAGAAAEGSRSGKSGGRRILSAGALSVAAAGAVMSGVSVARLDGSFRRYVEDPSEHHRSAVWGNITMGAAGALLTGIALACAGVTLVF